MYTSPVKDEANRLIALDVADDFMRIIDVNRNDPDVTWVKVFRQATSDFGWLVLWERNYEHPVTPEGWILQLGYTAWVWTVQKEPRLVEIEAFTGGDDPMFNREQMPPLPVGPSAVPSGTATGAEQSSLAAMPVTPKRSKARSSIQVDLEDSGSEDDAMSDESEPELITRDMIVALWKGTTTKVREKTMLGMDEMGLPGVDILAYCLGLETADGVDRLLSHSALYKMGKRAIGERNTSQKRQLYAEKVLTEVRALRVRVQEAQSACADPDADGAEPVQVRAEEWCELSAEEQAAKLGYRVRVLARQGLLGPKSWYCCKCSRINTPLDTQCSKCKASQQEAFGGYILPAQDQPSFQKLKSYYDKIDQDALIRKRQNRLPKRAQKAMARAAEGNAWSCASCEAKGDQARMSLTVERCYRCKGPRPLELKAQAKAFQLSPEGTASASRKKQRKAESRGWTQDEWDEYERIRQDRLDRGSVVSSHFYGQSTSGSVCSDTDIANMSDVRDFPDDSTPAIPEDEQFQSTSQSSTGWSGSGWSGSYDKWTSYRDRKYRHVQNGAARATFALVGLVLLQPGEAASTVAILAPLGSGSALLIMAKLFLFSSTVKVVNKVSEDAEFLTSSAIDAADQAILWTLWLYQIVVSILCLVLLLGSYKWVNSIGCTERQPAAGPAGQAPDSAK
jgi:hypothetical protein